MKRAKEGPHTTYLRLGGGQALGTILRGGAALRHVIGRSCAPQFFPHHTGKSVRASDFHNARGKDHSTLTSPHPNLPPPTPARNLQKNSQRRSQHEAFFPPSTRQPFFSNHRKSRCPPRPKCPTPVILRSRTSSSTSSPRTSPRMSAT